MNIEKRHEHEVIDLGLDALNKICSYIVCKFSINSNGIGILCISILNQNRSQNSLTHSIRVYKS